MTPRVSLADVTFTYPGADRAALSGVSLDIVPGEIVAVAGAAGAGASTLLLVATGLAPRLVGGTLSGSARSEPAAAASCSPVPGPSSRASAPRSGTRWRSGRRPTACRVRRCSRRPHGRWPGWASRISRTAIRRTSPAAKSSASSWLPALALEPDLLALDDPAAELDPEAADALYAMLPALARAGAAILIATPDIRARGARRHAGDRAGPRTGRARWGAGGGAGMIPRWPRPIERAARRSANGVAPAPHGAMSAAPRAAGLPVEWDGVTFGYDAGADVVQRRVASRRGRRVGRALGSQRGGQDDAHADGHRPWCVRGPGA